MFALLIRVLIEALKNIVVKLPLSATDLDDPAAVRAWLQRVLDTLKWLADFSPTSIDNDLVVVLDRLLSDDEAWDATYRVIHRLIHGDDQAVVYGAVPEMDQQRIQAVGAIDWSKIAEIIKAIAEMLRIILNK